MCLAAGGGERPWALASTASMDTASTLAQKPPSSPDACPRAAGEPDRVMGLGEHEHLVLDRWSDSIRSRSREPSTLGWRARADPTMLDT